MWGETNFLENANSKYLEEFKSIILKLDESEREANWKALIEAEKSKNPGLFYLLDMMVSAKVLITSEEKIGEAIKIYRGESILTEHDDEISGILSCITAIGLFGLETPAEFKGKINQFTAARVLSL